MKPRDPDHPDPASKANGPHRGGGRLRHDKAHAAAPAAPAAAPRRATPAASGPDLKSILQALKRRWLVAATVSLLLGGAAGAAAWFGLAAKYTAFAQLRVAAVTPYLVFSSATNPEGRSDFSTYQRTQAAAVKNRYVLNAALKRDDVRNLAAVRQQGEPITWLEDELKVELQEGSEIVNVKMSGAEAGDLVTLVNAVTQSYLQEVVNAERKQRSDRLAELDDVYTKSKEKLRLKRELLKKRAEEVGGSDTSALNHKQVSLLSAYGELRRQHAQVRFELMRAEGRLASFKARGQLMDKVTISETAVKAALESDSVVVGYRRLITQIDDALDRFATAGARKDDSAVVQLKERKEGLEQKIVKQQTEMRPKVLEALKAQAQDEYQAGLAQHFEEVQPLAAQEKILLAEVQALAAEADKIGASSTELEMLRAELKQEELVLERVGHELEALQVELRSPPRVSLYQEAGLAKRDTKRQIAAAALAPILVTLLVCLAVGWWEHRARRIHTADEVISGLGMRILGTVPPLSQVRVVQADGSEQPADSYQEAIDGIRTVLLRDAATQGTRVVMVTSARHGEGKTTLAGHLATSLARSGRRTLLLDGDLRKPAAHQLFEVDLLPGFSEVLLEEIGLAAAIRPTALDTLNVVPAGQWDRTVLEALSREGVEKVFDQLAEEFELIIIDSHPVLDATDALLLGQHADAVIFSLVRDVSQMPHVYAAGQQLAGVGVRILGAVINGMSAEDVYHPATALAAAVR
jgi:capsular exopolysaccharide synthesis family protein